MAQTMYLPEVNQITLGAPLNWLGKGWRDFCRIPFPCLVYGFLTFMISIGLAVGLYLTGAIMWFLVLAAGFLVIAPMLAMGTYQAARMLEREQTPTVSDMLFVGSAFRRDLVILGVALVFLFGLWIEVAYLAYGLSTRTMHSSVLDFLVFFFTTPEGHRMALIGSAIGGVIAFLAFSLVVISAPMLLNEERDIFIATITSLRAVARNPLPMLFWAILIVALTLVGVATALLGLIVIFPWIGLASWHAYRELVPRAALTANEANTLG